MAERTLYTCMATTKGQRGRSQAACKLTFRKYLFWAGAAVGSQIIQASTALEITWSAIPFCIFMVIFVGGAMIYFKERTPPRGATEGLRCSQTVDVETTARRRTARSINERCVFRGPRREDYPDLAGCRPQLLHVPRVPYQAGCAARPKDTALVSSHQSGNVSPVVKKPLRSQHSSMIGQVVVLEPAEVRPGSAGRVGGINGFVRAIDFSAARLLHLPSFRYAGPPSQSHRAVRLGGATKRGACSHRR